ncbi:hypothetical protein CKY39_07905 [Variovorax boronicumulans]|uniref:Uncharacterized protein n=1 Tax=Variovorax boronicumulans TaxID=436515 RepID=A0A250DFW6_9BURK|nr:hypothetical protein [Variovorax boronicumulans]ATA53142.1 hypothetical protein CKY39_07905 [Variovorax boronicumulans]
MKEILGLLKVDLTKVSADVWEGLLNGTMDLSYSKGMVHWAAGSGRTGIVAHLPMVPVSPEELASAEQLLQVGKLAKGAQVASVAATATAAVVVVAVVVAATIYLSSKIDKVENAIAEVARTIGQQDRREYLKYFEDYAGAVRSAQAMLNSRVPVSEISRMAEMRLDRLSEARHQILGFVRGLQSLCGSSQSNQVQYALAIGFMIDVLDLVPAALIVERELCLVAGMPGMAQRYREQVRQEFRQELERFREWCDTQYRQLALGRGGFPDVLAENRDRLKALFGSRAQDILLSDPLAPFFATAASATGPKEQASHEHPPNTKGRDRTA